METKGTRTTLGQAAGDFIELVAKALLSGVGVAVAMALAILALSATAQAADTVGVNDTKTGRLLLRTATPGRYDVAPTMFTEVAIEVHGMVARTAVTQYFKNPGADFVEGLYAFPLPEKAAVDHLYMRIGTRVIEGQVREKGEARRTYEKARAEGRKAALVEQQRPNLFTNAVAHIGPGDTIEVRIEYQQSLAYDDGTWRLRFPLAVTPRFSPAVAASGEKAAGGDGEAIPADGCGAVDSMVDIVVMVDAGVPIADVVSSYHEAIVEKAASGRTTIYLSHDQEKADRDFELSWRVATGAEPQASIFLERREDAQYALLMVVPPRPTAEEAASVQRLPRETIFIIDTSGSMAGTSIAQAKAAMGVALATLSARDRFNVVEFNSATRPLFPASVAATPENLRHAAQWVGALQARGGTEMAPALEFALAGRDDPALLRQVVFMTDGGVTHEDALFALIAAKLGRARLFTVGIGSAPNGHFMTKAAEFGRGTFTYIGDVREVAEKMSRLFAKIEAPVLRDVQVRWSDGTPVETFPARVPDLYLGEPVVVAAASRGWIDTVVVSGTRGNQPWSVALTPPTESSSGVGALWARSKIAGLMDELARGGDVAAIRPAVIRVALDHHLVSAYTSLVAVDATPTGPQDGLRPAVLTTSTPPGWTGSLPQTDTPARLQLLLGMCALLCAGLVAMAGRRLEARA